MPTSFKDIEQQAVALPEDDRAALAEILLQSLHSSHPDVKAAWASEIDNRVAALNRGELQSYPAEDVFAEARRLSR
jgi:putative addiction module component (TIGR02574 family)